MDEYTVTALVIAALVVVVFAAMLLGWRGRRRRQSELEGASPVPAERATPTLRTEGLYLATTLAGQPYERVTAGGLGFRARAAIELGPDGLLLELRGSEPRWVPASAIRGAGRSTWTIGRVVERDGLVLVGWRQAERDLDSYFRVDDPAALVAAVEALHQKETA